MELCFSVECHELRFLKPAKTSRNTFTEKKHWIIKIWDALKPGNIGLGEAAPIEFLSPDYREDLGTVIEQQLNLLQSFRKVDELNLLEFPAVKFAIETALLDLAGNGKQVCFKSGFLNGEPIPINGLVWMNDLDEMLDEAIAKAKSGFKCIKFKIGSHDFDAECRLLESFRQSKYGINVSIRLDANGAFLPGEALEKLRELKRFHIHSIEQPIKSGQWDEMARLCLDSKIDIALDEELIGLNFNIDSHRLLKTIKPAFLVLKPTLLGGFKACDQWVKATRKFEIGWWVTSSLESNIGLNAIAQWVGTYKPDLPQGLGTGLLFENNFPSKSEIREGQLYYRK